MKNILLDTNAFSSLGRGDLSVKKVIETADKVLIPVIVIGELLYGFKNGSKEDINRELLSKFLNIEGIEVLNTSLETAEIFSDIMIELKQKGTPIPSNDIWIAALGIETGSVIITRDNHFIHISKARIWNQI